MPVAVFLILKADVLYSVCVTVILFGRLISRFKLGLNFFLLKYWQILKISGKTKDLTPQKISGVKMLINMKNYSNWEICRTVETSKSSVRQIKKENKFTWGIMPSKNE